MDLPLILIIEDDQNIQAVLDQALDEAGFAVALADSGEEAVTLLNGKAAPYRALVTDVNLPGSIDGWQLARAVREVDPEFPIIYMTGAAAEQWASQGVPNSILLTKPFAPAQLITAVSQLLNIGSPPTE